MGRRKGGECVDGSKYLRSCRTIRGRIRGSVLNRPFHVEGGDGGGGGG